MAVYKALPDGKYVTIEVLGETVSKGLSLPLLANAKLHLWLEDRPSTCTREFVLASDASTLVQTCVVRPQTEWRRDIAFRI